MPTKKNSAKSRVSARSKKQGFKFKWWMGLIIIVVIGGIGLIALRFSQASGYINFTAGVLGGGYPHYVSGVKGPMVTYRSINSGEQVAVVGSFARDRKYQVCVYANADEELSGVAVSIINKHSNKSFTYGGEQMIYVGKEWKIWCTKKNPAGDQPKTFTTYDSNYANSSIYITNGTSATVNIGSIVVYPQ